MVKLSHVIPVVIFSAIIALAFFIILRRCLRPKPLAPSAPVRAPTLHNGIARLHQVSPLNHHRLDRESFRKSHSYHHLFQSGLSAHKTPRFSWSDHPSSVTDAVENGWPRFAFATFATSSSSSVKSARALFGSCAAADDEPTVEIGWEVCEGSADFMQKIRLNPESRKGMNSSYNCNHDHSISVIRAALPLPGPNLGVNSSFPQEAYFEITVMPRPSHKHQDANILLPVHTEKGAEFDADKVKLIGEDFNAKSNTSRGSFGAKMEDLKTRKHDDISDSVSVCVGLTGGTPLPSRIPGSYHGSIAFNSNGSVYLDGTKVVFESKNHQWGLPNKVIGCGYNPSQKKVFFSVDAQLVHEIHCRTEDFSSPLYPTLASKDDITVLVNLGQSPFKYPPANLLRTPNPCFVRPLRASPALGYEEDSRELFSMGRLDSHWLQRSERSHNNTVNSIRALEYDQESDGDLFEIVLDNSNYSTGRSPSSCLYGQ